VGAVAPNLLNMDPRMTERKNRLFKNKKNSAHQLLDKVKLHSYWWMKAYDTYIGLNLICGGQIRLCVFVYANSILFPVISIAMYVNFEILVDTPYAYKNSLLMLIYFIFAC